MEVIHNLISKDTEKSRIVYGFTKMDLEGKVERNYFLSENLVTPIILGPQETLKRIKEEGDISTFLSYTGNDELEVKRRCVKYPPAHTVLKATIMWDEDAPLDMLDGDMTMVPICFLTAEEDDNHSLFAYKNKVDVSFPPIPYCENEWIEALIKERTLTLQVKIQELDVLVQEVKITLPEEIPIFSSEETNIIIASNDDADDITLGDEGELAAMEQEMAANDMAADSVMDLMSDVVETLVEMDALDDTPLTDEEIIERDLAAATIFPGSDELDQLDKEKEKGKSILADGEIEKFEKVAETLTKQIGDARKSFNKKLNDSGMTGSVREQMLKEFNKHIKPMTDQLSQLVESLEKLKAQRDKLKESLSK